MLAERVVGREASHDGSWSRRAPATHPIRAAALFGLAAALVSGVGGCASSGSKPVAASGSRLYTFWPQPPADPRIQFVRSFIYSTDVSQQQQSGLERLVFGAETANAVEINKPYGIEMRNGRIYVCDIRNVGLTILDLDQKQTRLVGSAGLNRLQNPVDVAVADDGTIYVADKLRGVVVYDASERYATTFGHDNFQPIGVAVRGDRLYVCNMGAQNVEIMNRRTGQTIGTFGTVGDGDGQFRLPLGIDIDPDGNVHVADVMRCRLQKFTPDGGFLAGVGTMNDTAGNFVRPKHVAIDSDGNVYVVDAAFQNVQIFDKDYQLLTSFGQGGSFPGALSLPAGICVNDDAIRFFADEAHPLFETRHVVLVSNQFGDNKVAVYLRGQVREGHSGQELAGSLTPIGPAPGAPAVNPLSGLDAQPLPEDQPPGTDATSPAVPSPITPDGPSRP